AIPLERLVVWSGISLTIERLRRILNERWRPFVVSVDHGRQAHYRLNHVTLREFCTGQVNRDSLTSGESAFVDELAAATLTAHHRLAERYLDAWGSLDEDLPRLDDPAARDLDDRYG